jgi:uncharacterized membrane protein
MRNALLLPLLLAAGCAASPRPYAPVRDVAYQALGARTFWVLTIGDDRIVFRPVHGGGERSWPRVLPRTRNGVRTWHSGEGAEGITIEARPGPCADRSERLHEDVVTVRMGDEGPELEGCGGRLIRPERR